ncbi:MAG: hypothetical protein PHD95_04200, partial [Candidatus ainarchaeum sp.]|nr:hypothetical protein [Candidatus ainarchaeum sp.]
VSFGFFVFRYFFRLIAIQTCLHFNRTPIAPSKGRALPAARDGRIRIKSKLTDIAAVSAGTKVPQRRISGS